MPGMVMELTQATTPHQEGGQYYFPSRGTSCLSLRPASTGLHCSNQAGSLKAQEASVASSPHLWCKRSDQQAWEGVQGVLVCAHTIRYVQSQVPLKDLEQIVHAVQQDAILRVHPVLCLVPHH